MNNLINSRESLAWALDETRKKLRTLYPDADDQKILHGAAHELRNAMRRGDARDLDRR